MKLRALLMRVAVGGFLVVLVGLIVVYVLTRQPPPVAAAPIQARLELAAGEVTLGTGAEGVRAVSGTPLLAGAEVATAQGARALVRLPDGSSIFLRDETAVKLGEGSLALERGEYWLEAPPVEREPLAHQAGDVSVAAADAGLSVKRDGSTVTVYVARGMAIVTGPGGRVEVNSGEQTVVAGAEAPQVSAVAFWDDWTGGMADFESGQGIPGSGTGTIYGVDSGAAPGSPARRLEISKQVVRATVREGLSETEVDQTFFNPGERVVEGWYWFTVPERASVTGFAVETDGRLVEGEFQEKKEAAANYTTAKAVGHAPAILEWIDNRTYRARIYPINPGGTRRVVLRYIELRPIVDGRLEYLYPMGARDPARIGEFSLKVDLGEAGKKMHIATLADARVEDDGRLITMRRSGYTPRADFQLEATLPEGRRPFTVARYRADGESADYIMARYTPDVDWTKVQAQPGEIVVVVDTSAAGDDAARQLKAATAEAILRALSQQDRFALVSLDSKPTVLHPQQGLAPASDQEIDRALEKLAEHSAGGATDLSALFDVALKRLHGAEQPAVVYVGDGIATSGDMTGEELTERLRRALATSRARLFTVGVGMDADQALLGELARAGGGESFRVDQSEETTARALQLAAALKVATITDLEIQLGAGLDEPFTTANGKVSRGSEVIVLARTHHEVPSKVTVKGRVGGEAFERSYDVYKDKTVLSAFVPRLWAAEYVRRLLGSSQGPDAERGRIVALGLEYGLMTPFTSVLALESERAYRNMGIERNRSKLRGPQLGALEADAEWRIGERHAAPIVAPAVFGCSREDFASIAQKSEASEESADNKEGGTGTRAKGEEGSMGDSNSPSGLWQGSKPAVATEDREAEEVEAPAALAADEPAPAAPPAPQPRKAALAPGRARAGGMGALGFGSGGGGKPDTDDAVAGLKRELDEVRQEAERARLAEKAAQNELRQARDGALKDERVVARVVELGTCSDAARRPLAQRVLMWRKRIKTARDAQQLVSRYDAAQTACELPDWRAERTFLDLMQQRIESEGGARVALEHFRARPEVQKYVAKLILRRTVDERVVAAVEAALFGSAVDWREVDRELTSIEDPTERIATLREAMARAPDDPNGGMRLVRLLVEVGQKDQALALGRRLRDQGFMTPLLARQLGDVLARAGLATEAVRTYSEIVEFDPYSTSSRRLLGDIYLGHGWYGPAYRQYATLTEVAPEDALAWLRLAAAAAGTGRVDEALRLERKVSSAQGTPGPTDPRRWARTMSAARLARLIAQPPKAAPGQDPKRRLAGIKRELKELQLFSGPGTLVVLTWEDLAADVLLASQVEEEDVALGEATDAAPIGLSAVLLATTEAERATFVARVRNLPRDHAVQLTRHDIRWDQKDFHVRVETREVPARAASAPL